ncbi:hypothetical protein [uncultured Thiodictyon sp.]|uniref:hypothetical protein n=1 Tax=uncultured Thiodictyon sp. TaxID=1846217 RepID=UPI0025D1E3EB|nr:hypothetical protein [uncultured Thiodictyon sp.]
MHQTKPPSAQIRGLLTLTLALPGAVFASYDGNDAIRDCESRIRSEYKISDLRDATVQRLNDGALHFKVHGMAKVDGDKHPWTCEVNDRHVTAAEYSGPKPKGLSTAQQLALGTAALVAGGVAINEMSKQGGTSQSGSGAGGAKELQDLVGARAAGGESELQSRGYTYASGSKGGDSSYTNWKKGSHCVTVRTTNGHYKSIVDVTMLDCGGGGQSGPSRSASGGSGAAGLKDLVGARAAGGETELQNRGYNFVAGNKWSNGSQCVTVRTRNGHYASIVDMPMAKCH